AAQAVDIDYDPRRAEALRRCDEPGHQGRVEQARQCFGALLQHADPLVRAEAAFALGDLRTANEPFRAAVRATGAGPLRRLGWGRMFLEAGQDPDALALFQEVRELDGDDAGARRAMARLGVERFEGDISEEIAALLAQDPALIEAHL